MSWRNLHGSSHSSDGSQPCKLSTIIIREELQYSFKLCMLTHQKQFGSFLLYFYSIHISFSQIITFNTISQKTTTTKGHWTMSNRISRQQKTFTKWNRVKLSHIFKFTHPYVATALRSFSAGGRRIHFSRMVIWPRRQVGAGAGHSPRSVSPLSTALPRARWLRFIFSSRGTCSPDRASKSSSWTVTKEKVEIWLCASVRHSPKVLTLPMLPGAFTYFN